MTDKQQEKAARKRVYRKAEIVAQYEGITAQEVIDDLVEIRPHITIGQLDFILTKTIDLCTGTMTKADCDFMKQRIDEDVEAGRLTIGEAIEGLELLRGQEGGTL